MFDSMYFTKSAGIDSKNRIFLPAKTGLETGAQIAIAELDNFYGLYLLERLDALVEKLRSNCYQVTEKQRREILKQLNYIFNAIKTVNPVDSQRRLSLPSEVAEQSKGEGVILQGRKDHLAMFMNQEAFEQYQQGDNFSKITL